MVKKGDKVRLVFDDGSKVSFRDGVITNQDEFSIELDYKESISRSRIIRIEVQR